MQVLLFIFTIYALLGDDLRLLLFTKPSDPFFIGLNVLTLCFFITELVISSVVIKSYFLNFFFWLDLIAALSIITDIEPIWNVIIGIEDSDEPLDEDNLGLRGGQRGARLSTKAGRMARVVRLFRLIRIVKLYKQTLQHIENE